MGTKTTAFRCVESHITVTCSTSGGISEFDTGYRTAFVNIPDNVLQFPLSRRRDLRTCPHCGTHSDVWQIGRLLWGYCDVHEVRWVVADYHAIPADDLDRNQLRRGLEFLSAFVEVSR